MFEVACGCVIDGLPCPSWLLVWMWLAVKEQVALEYLGSNFVKCFCSWSWQALI